MFRRFSLPFVSLFLLMVSAGSGSALPLSPGDRISVTIPGDEALAETYRFSGLYEVNLDGTLEVPLLDPIRVAGLELSQVEQELARELLAGGFFQPNFLQLSVQVVDWGPIQVNVSGATFVPGRVLLGDRFPANEPPEPNARLEPSTRSGEYPEGRYLTAAIRRAGGLLPNADVENIELIRGEQKQIIDLSGLFTGDRTQDIPLIAGDQIIVPELNVIQSRLVRPSQVTPSTIAIFLSGQSTATIGGVSRVAEFEYGSRFVQAAIAANCAGGSRSTNANRRITLVQTERVSGQTKVHDHQVEELIRNSADEITNPFLMPGDSVICYDSRVTNLSNILNFIGGVLNPIRLIDSIFFSND